ncbi:MAG: hypothetical protein II501_00520 [Clostridia bacterium]|nr:hypothetical protein [Clostridia bacterium]
MSTTAILSNDNRFTSFEYDGIKIRFVTPKCLEKYTRVLEWDNGYIVVTALYNGIETEEYIDLISVLQNLCIEPEEFLKNIKEVSIKYD